MSDMISVASDFQYSVNIAYDLNSNERLKNYIPTKSALDLLEDVLLSAEYNSNERARILIGPYGKGKSHLVLIILSVLMKKDLKLFELLMAKIQENPNLNQLVQNYYSSENKILPVIITGNSASLPQTFLLALQRTLSENDLMDIMPETNYKAAVSVIERWREEFPETYVRLQQQLDYPVEQFVAELKDFSTESYRKFETIYHELTSGSVFNPFVGFDVIELYEEAVQGLKKKGYSGIYVVYDEFSKYLEANISEASVSDTKMLQDFAEKCNRSGKNQLHLLLISHKEISNYINKLPRQKVDGWRGVSERFKHVRLSDSFTQTYEIISTAIRKNKKKWDQFCIDQKTFFDNIRANYETRPLYEDLTSDDLFRVIYGCYPLHPVSTFLLPRLSERVAQNERTLFTFLAAQGQATLLTFLETYQDDRIALITPDLIYDYFEPLFKKELHSGVIYESYHLAAMVLGQFEEASLKSKIIKTIALIYMLEQFDKLSPTKDEIVTIFRSDYNIDEITQALDQLEADKMLYIRNSNGYFRIKQSSGVDIEQKIDDEVLHQQSDITVKDILNASNLDNYIYPSRYNDDREITRYFAFVFIDADEISEDINWSVKGERIDADGIMYGVVLHEDTNINRINKIIFDTTQENDRFIYAIPRSYDSAEKIIRRFYAVRTLRDKASDDKILFDEYQMVYEDLSEVIGAFILSYTRPERHKSDYIYKGEVRHLLRKSALTALMSEICFKVYSKTPIINNEVINRGELTATARNSRNKIVAALLRGKLEKNLGLLGYGQEVSVMRSTLIRTGIWLDSEEGGYINLRPDKKTYPHIAEMLSEIEQFIAETRSGAKMCFLLLYDKLTSPENHFGLRKGVIPIYLAAVLHECRQTIVIWEQGNEVPISADVLMQINAKPENFYLSYLEWNKQREAYVDELASIFDRYINEAEKSVNWYEFVGLAMKRWFYALPKYAKESKKDIHGECIPKQYNKFIQLLRQSNLSSNQLLFEKIPNLFGQNEFNETLIDSVRNAKNYYDEMLFKLISVLTEDIKQVFGKSIAGNLDEMSLTSIVSDWCAGLEQPVFEQLFSDGTDRCLKLLKRATDSDENTLVLNLAKQAIGLNVNDWDNSKRELFIKKLRQYKKTAEEYHAPDQRADERKVNTYQISYLSSDGERITKRFDRVNYSRRAKLLYNQISNALAQMGHSISEQEKRQVLMEILQDLC